MMIAIALIGLFADGVLRAQTAPNTPISNQARSVFQYRSFPSDTVLTNIVTFTVVEAPNFEISFGNPDSLVFSKETLAVALVYRNVGNQTADTALIEGVLPPAGMKFLPGSTGGVISGSTVTWRVFNVPPGRSDTVRVKVIVDSNLAVNTQLTMNADISWENSIRSTAKTFVISMFPRIAISLVPEQPVVGSGRVLRYTVTVVNQGNVPATGTVVYDSISTHGSYFASSITPDSVSNNQRTVKWSIGSVPAFSSRSFTVDIRTAVNIGHVDLLHSVRTFSTNDPEGDRSTTITRIVPILPKSVAIVPQPEFVFGQVNKDSSLVSVTVKDSLGTILPDGTPITLTATIGTFHNGATTFPTTVQNGSASVRFRTVNVQNEILRSRITAVAGTPSLGTKSDTANIYIYPGAVTGAVVSGINKVPLQGAIARVTDARNSIVGVDTTKSDGKFFIALNKDITKYLLEIVVLDKFGDSVKTQTEVDPTKFPLPPIVIPNVISGRIEYKISGTPVPAESVTVFLDSLAPSNVRSPNIRTLQRQNLLTRVQQQKTDANGRFKFEGLRPARYVISVDSAAFPNFTGFTFVSDTSSGTVTVNLNLQITLDSTVSFTAAGPSTASAGDTVTVSARIVNTGNVEHRTVAVTDTLSPFVRFVSASSGNFTPALYDSVTRVVRWTKDTLKTLTSDSVTIRFIVSSNIPDSTRIMNRFWYSSHLLSANSTLTTTIRSKGNLVFSNSFTVPRDTIIAGDSIRHVFRFSNTGTDSIRGIRIVDTLFSAGLSGISLAKSSLDSTKIVDSVSTIYLGSLAPGVTDSVSLKLVTDFALRNDVAITSHAYVMKGDSILARKDTTLRINENPNIASFLKIVKTGNKKVTEIGDIVTYQIVVSNSSPQFLRNTGIYDLLPYAFQYVKNSARYNGKPVEPVIDPVNNQLRWNMTDTIPSSKQSLLVYQLAIGADAMESEGVNTAYASAVAGLGTTLVSSPSQWQVTVRPGVFTEKGLIIGKVFYDDNRNAYQDKGETGIKDVELWMEDGTKIITGDDGKFSLPEVKPGQHVLRVNERTLPNNDRLIAGNNAFAKDPTSRFVRVTESGIARANFYVRRSVSDSIKHSVAKVNKVTAVRQAIPKYLYDDTLRKIRVDTVKMFIAFAYSGNRPVEKVTIEDHLHERLTLIPNSALFNGKRINPVMSGNNIRWNIGKGNAVYFGKLSYSAIVTSFPKVRTVLTSASSVAVMSTDSIIVEGGHVYTDNIVLDTMKNRIETSELNTSASDPRVSNHLSDSVTVTVGDDLFFKTALYIDPNKKITEAKIIDTLPSNFIVNDRSFFVNGIPVPSRNLSFRIRSMAISSSEKQNAMQLEFFRIASMDLGGLLRSGANVITYSARLQSAARDTVFKKRTYATITNEFDETAIVRSADATIIVKANINSAAVPLETTFVDIERPSINVVEKVVEAVKLLESLRETSSGPIVMEGIIFELSKATLTAESKVVLDNIAEMLKANPDIAIQINGYTDNTGNANANRRMSLNRAKEVAAYLVSKGVESRRLMPQGFGPANPIASNKTEEGRAKNRRVEFERVK